MVTDKKLIRQAGKLAGGHSSHRHRHMCIQIRWIRIQIQRPLFRSPRQLDYSYLNSSYTLSPELGFARLARVSATPVLVAIPHHLIRILIPIPIHTPNIIWIE